MCAPGEGKKKGRRWNQDARERIGGEEKKARAKLP